MRPIEPYILHAALRADQDEEARVYHLREQIELDLPDETVAVLEEMARGFGCDLEVLCNAILTERLERPGL